MTRKKSAKKSKSAPLAAYVEYVAIVAHPEFSKKVGYIVNMSYSIESLLKRLEEYAIKMIPTNILKESNDMVLILTNQNTSGLTSLAVSSSHRMDLEGDDVYIPVYMARLTEERKLGELIEVNRVADSLYRLGGIKALAEYYRK